MRRSSAQRPQFARRVKTDESIPSDGVPVHQVSKDDDEDPIQELYLCQVKLAEATKNEKKCFACGRTDCPGIHECKVLSESMKTPFSRRILLRFYREQLAKYANQSQESPPDLVARQVTSPDDDDSSQGSDADASGNDADASDVDESDFR